MAPPERPPARSLADVPYRECAAALRTQSARQIVRHYGVARSTARYWRRQLGIAGPAPGPLAPALLAVLQLIDGGATTRDLVEWLGGQPTSVHPALRTLERRGQVRSQTQALPGSVALQVRWYPCPAGERERTP